MQTRSRTNARPAGTSSVSASSCAEVVHPDAAVAQRLGEHVVLFPGLLGPHHVVEQQLADVLRGEPGQLQPGPVDDRLAQLPDF